LERRRGVVPSRSRLEPRVRGGAGDPQRADADPRRTVAEGADRLGSIREEKAPARVENTMPHLTNPSFETRLRRYALSAASVTAASAATGVAVAGGVPPTMAASGAGWSWSNTLLNNANGAAGGAVRTANIWGPGGSLLSNNFILDMARQNNGLGAAGTWRNISFSQTGWDPGVHLLELGGPAAAGAIIDSNAAFALGRSESLVRSTRAGSLANTTATWGTQAGYPSMVMGKSSRVYLTFRITDFGNTYYGWLDLQTQENASKDLTFTIHGWAYSTGSILVGAAPVAIPGGAGLAVLAFGAAGLRGRRRSRVA
jgi:hypothetical protein